MGYEKHAKLSEGDKNRNLYLYTQEALKVVNYESDGVVSYADIVKKEMEESGDTDDEFDGDTPHDSSMSQIQCKVVLAGQK